MYNQFRTLLLNLSYANTPDEHIPASFNALSLPSSLLSIYKVLFPDSTSRYFKMFLVHNYMEIIKAAGRIDDIKQYDNRLVYNTDDTEFFKISRYSNPAISSVTNPIYIFGSYQENTKNAYFYDDFLITQVGTSNNITIFSTINNWYILPNGTTVTDAGSANIPLTFEANGVSQVVPVGNTGISFAINGSNFSNGGGRTWEFLVEAPYIFDFNFLLTNLQIVKAGVLIEGYKTNVDVATYLNLWKSHPNPIYKVAGLLLAYAAKVNSLL